MGRERRHTRFNPTLQLLGGLRIEKRGDHIYMFLAPKDRPMEFSGASVQVKLEDPFYVGLGVCSHEKDVPETAVFSNVRLETDLPAAITQPALNSTLETITVASTDRRVTYTAPGRMEARTGRPTERRFCSTVMAVSGACRRPAAPAGHRHRIRHALQ